MGTSASLQNKDHEGQTIFIADGVTDFVDIIHNAGYVPTSFSLSTLTPISINHLNRLISFPSNNTIRITFTNPPIIGEDITYVWSVPRK